MKWTILMMALFLLPLLAAAGSITVSGYVTEKKSGERLAGVTVYIPNKNAGTATDASGFYSITVPADTLELHASFIGFQPFVKTVYSGQNINLNIELEQPAGKELKEVTVKAAKEKLQEQTQMSSIDLPIQTIKSLPAFLGETDILKAVQLLPGVQAGSEGSSGIYVRGGGPDENLILLDGVPIYNASHIFGFFSVFNADAVSNVNVIKGGFPARYGGRLSSVIDVDMKDGDMNTLHGEGGIGLVASRLMLEGPIRKGKSSFMVSARRSYTDLITRPLMQKDMDIRYYFYDLNAKLDFYLGPKDHLFLSGYYGKDDFNANLTNEDNTFFKAGINWGNTIGSARWNHQFNSKLYGNLTAYYSGYKFGTDVESGFVSGNNTNTFRLNNRSGIQDVALKYDFNYRPNANHTLRMGVSAVNHRYSPSALQSQVSQVAKTDSTSSAVQLITAMEYDAYVEDEMRISDKLKANIGLHATGFAVRDQLFKSLQPRVALRYLLTDALSVKASYVQMNQFVHLLTNSSVGLPTDLWVPATDKVPPMKSQQGALGFAYTSNKGYEFSVEGYYKTMDNVIEYKEGASFLSSSNDWEDKVTSGKGNSYGAEVFIQKKVGRFTGLLGYTLSWTNRMFADLNNGDPFPYRYDRRHDFKMAGVYKVSKGIELSAEWVYGTGNAITMPIGAYNGPDGQITMYGSRNGYRMGPYHRGDVSIKFSRKHARWERAWILGAYNVYNRQNPFFIYESTDQQGNPKFREVSIFPILPSVSFQFKF